VDKQRRKSWEIGVQRGCERVARIGVGQLQASGWGDGRAVEDRAAPGVRADRFAGGGKIGPRREKRGGSGKGRARGAESEHERKRKCAARRVAGNNNALLRTLSRKKPAINRSGILHGGGKGIFGGQAIVRSENTEAVHGKKGGDGTMRLGRTGEIAAAMQIEEHLFGGTWRLDPFARDAV